MIKLEYDEKELKQFPDELQESIKFWINEFENLSLDNFYYWDGSISEDGDRAGQVFPVESMEELDGNTLSTVFSGTSSESDDENYSLFWDTWGEFLARQLLPDIAEICPYQPISWTIDGETIDNERAMQWGFEMLQKAKDFYSVCRIRVS